MSNSKSCQQILPLLDSYLDERMSCSEKKWLFHTFYSVCHGTEASVSQLVLLNRLSEWIKQKEVGIYIFYIINTA